MDEAQWIPLHKYKEVVASNERLVAQLAKVIVEVSEYRSDNQKMLKELTNLRDFRRSIVENSKALLGDI